MSDPTRIKYRTHKKVPPTPDLLTHVTRDQHLVLEFPANYSQRRIESLIDRIAGETPENYTAFYSGAFRDKTCATIKQVVTRAAVLEMEDYLVEAAHHFRQTATQLAEALAAHNSVSIERLWKECRNLESHDSDWDLDVHGQHCRFEHRDTGQTVEISMWFGTHFGVLDPLFFSDYMKTTPDLAPPSDLRDGFHDTRRAMDILEERGRLVRVTGLFNSEGLTAPPERKKRQQDVASQSVTHSESNDLRN